MSYLCILVVNTPLWFTHDWHQCRIDIIKMFQFHRSLVLIHFLLVLFMQVLPSVVRYQVHDVVGDSFHCCNVVSMPKVVGVMAHDLGNERFGQSRWSRYVIFVVVMDMLRCLWQCYSVGRRDWRSRCCHCQHWSHGGIWFAVRHFNVKCERTWEGVSHRSVHPRA